MRHGVLGRYLTNSPPWLGARRTSSDQAHVVARDWAAAGSRKLAEELGEPDRDGVEDGGLAPAVVTDDERHPGLERLVEAFEATEVPQLQAFEVQIEHQLDCPERGWFTALGG